MAGVASIGAVVTFEEPTTFSADFLIRFQTQTALQEISEKSRQGGGDIEFEVAVDRLNLTRLEFTVEFAGDGPRQAQRSVEINVKAPDGREANGTGSLPAGGAGSDTVTLDEFALAVMPGGAEFSASNSTNASEVATARYATMNGTGTWIVTVSFQVLATDAIPQAAETLRASVEVRHEFFVGEVSSAEPPIPVG